MENAKKQRSYLGNKLLLNDYKKDKSIFLNDKYLKSNCSVISSAKDVMFKTYFDTSDFYFQSKGINISRNAYKNNPICELLVRYDSDVERIGFLSDMPDTFKIFINVKDNISKYFEYITDSIKEIYPIGLNCDIMQVVSAIKPVVNIVKKREKYKVSHINGLKLNVSFDIAEYTSPLVKEIAKLNELELSSESFDKVNEFDLFTKHLILENPQLILLKHSDIFIAKEYIFYEKAKDTISLEDLKKQNLLKSLLETKNG